MGYPAGEPSDRLHLLGLMKLRFELFLLTAVGKGNHDAREGTLPQDRMCDAFRLEGLAVGAGDRHGFRTAGLCRAECPAHGAALARAGSGRRGRMDERVYALAKQLARRISEEPGRRPIDERAQALAVNA